MSCLSSRVTSRYSQSDLHLFNYYSVLFCFLEVWPDSNPGQFPIIVLPPRSFLSPNPCPPSSYPSASIPTCPLMSAPTSSCSMLRILFLIRAFRFAFEAFSFLLRISSLWCVSRNHFENLTLYYQPLSPLVYHCVS